MGLDVYLFDHQPGEDERHADVPSTKYPDHLFNRTYLRSSYNGGGFDNVVSALIGKDLYWIFEPGTDAYEITPTKEQLTAARERAVTVLDELRAAPSLGVDFVGRNPFLKPNEGLVRSDEEAMAIFLEERAKNVGNESAFRSYGNIRGEFHFDEEPLRVRGVIPGSTFMGQGVYLVFEKDLSSYIQSAEIIIEFIDEALSYEKPVIHWSS